MSPAVSLATTPVTAPPSPRAVQCMRQLFSRPLQEALQELHVLQAQRGSAGLSPIRLEPEQLIAYASAVETTRQAQLPTPSHGAEVGAESAGANPPAPSSLLLTPAQGGAQRELFDTPPDATQRPQ